VGINNPRPAISGNGTAIASVPAGSTDLASDDSPIFHWRDDVRVTQKKAHRGGFYHDRRFATLPDVVKCYDSVFKLRLTD
jgi:hypothetical protein